MVKKLYLAFDLTRHRATARKFLTEMKERRLPFAVTAASRQEDVAATQRATLVVSRMREVDAVVVLIGPQSAVSKPLAEEIAHARQAGVRVVGVLVDGADVNVNLPKGLFRDHVYGWDWGQLGRVLR